jgi:tetratricopeptide (TPR) repeat protein
MRVIAIKAGRGNISASTVHNIFRSSKVPRWEFLEHIVKALGGSPRELAEFLALWQEAERAERAGIGAEGARQLLAGSGSTEGRGGNQRARLVTRPAQGTFAGGGAKEGADAAPRPPQRIWSPEIPPRNLNFTGRVAELEAMHENLNTRRSPHAQVIAGMGGIGKTELVTEFVHLYRHEYEIIWWIRAEHHDRVRDALVSLAQRLELRQASTDSNRDRTIDAVLEELQGDARTSWLLVYDNAVNPLDLQRYMPGGGPGRHIIVTSRQLNWFSFIPADGIELSPFTEEEAVSFLRRRVHGLALGSLRRPLTAEEDARRSNEASQLAIKLGCLPIALDHAAAYLAETGKSVDEYTARFTENAHQLLSEQLWESDLPTHVSGTWAISTTLLTPDAEHLFNLCAFFSPEPIAAGLFLQDTSGVDDPPDLGEFLSSARRFRSAATQLDRLSLARYDGARDLIQVHRVVQAVTQGRLRQGRPEMSDAYRDAVDTLLALSSPGNPDDVDNDVIYDLSLQHLESDRRFLDTGNTALRDLIIEQVRRLHLRGAHVEAMQFGQDALKVWQEQLGGDHLQTLTLAVEVAIAMYVGGHVADARELVLHVRPLLQRYTDGDGFKVLLGCETFYGADLRARSQFHEALGLDMNTLPKLEAVFGADHRRTLNVRNNIAIDYRHLGRFGEALEIDRRTAADRERILGASESLTLQSFSAVARDLRGLGEYEESLDIARRVASAFKRADTRENYSWLVASAGFATALRKAGHHWDALQESEHVLQRHRDHLGLDHMNTLAAAVNLINDRRAVGDLDGAADLARETYGLCQESDAPGDLLYATLLNLASVLRIEGRPGEALSYDDQTRKGLIRIYGDSHPFTLAANINYASDLAGCGRLGEAIQLGRATLDGCRETLGNDHPDTLMVAANLCIDEAATGDEDGAEQRLAAVLLRYEETLTREHPEARAAAQGVRLTAEIEPNV